MGDDYRHLPVLCSEVITGLNIRPQGCYIDATFGRGGHTRAILASLGAQGRLLAMDQDPAAVAAAEPLAAADWRLQVVHGSFADLAAIVDQAGISAVDGILFDLGVSSPQLDEAERGFSFRFDAPLDMRMDTSQGETAENWINRATEHEIADILRRFGDERYAFRIAKKIVAARCQQRITRTSELAGVIRACVPAGQGAQDAATRSFQAIRIFINAELDALTLALSQVMPLLKVGGRLAVISFHSLEDRIVKQFMRNEANRDSMPASMPIRHCDIPPPRLRVMGRAMRPSAAELAVNPRARSAVLRVAERLADVEVG